MILHRKGLFALAYLGMKMPSVCITPRWFSMSLRISKSQYSLKELTENLTWRLKGIHIKVKERGKKIWSRVSKKMTEKWYLKRSELFPETFLELSKTLFLRWKLTPVFSSKQNNNNDTLDINNKVEKGYSV